MADVMLMLGPYRFGLDTAAFQELNRNTEWRWPSQDVFGSRPVLQFTGFGQDAITLPGVIFPEYWGGTTQLEELRALGNTGQPQMLIDGRGNVMGRWVITSVAERGSVFAQGGMARRQEFTVSLLRYQDNGAAPLPVAAAVVAAAGADTMTGQAQSLVSAAQAKASQLVSSITSAAGAVSIQSVITSASRAVSVMQQVSTAASQAQSTIKALKGITSLTTAQSALGELMRSSASAAQVATTASRAIGGVVGGESDAATIAQVQAVLTEVNKSAIAATSIWSQAAGIVRKFQ